MVHYRSLNYKLPETVTAENAVVFHIIEFNDDQTWTDIYNGY